MCDGTCNRLAHHEQSETNNHLCREPNHQQRGLTSLYGEAIMGRKDPVQSKGGRLKERPLPFCVTNAQVWGPGL